MSRRRAGNGWTWRVKANGDTEKVMLDDYGRWISTGHARDWKRCEKCRQPIEHSPYESGLCSVCYFYDQERLTVEEFWAIQKEGYWLHPYNIGKQTHRQWKGLDNKRTY